MSRKVKGHLNRFKTELEIMEHIMGGVHAYRGPRSVANDRESVRGSSHEKRGNKHRDDKQKPRSE